jgi:hypothetical protein
MEPRSRLATANKLVLDIDENRIEAVQKAHRRSSSDKVRKPERVMVRLASGHVNLAGCFGVEKYLPGTARAADLIVVVTGRTALHQGRSTASAHQRALLEADVRQSAAAPFGD